MVCYESAVHVCNEIHEVGDSIEEKGLIQPTLEKLNVRTTWDISVTPAREDRDRTVAEETLLVWCEFQTSEGCIVRPCLKSRQQTPWLVSPVFTLICCKSFYFCWRQVPVRRELRTFQRVCVSPTPRSRS